MVHLRIVVPSHSSEHVLHLLEATPSACNVVFLERAAHKPQGDVILVDVAREDASVVVSDLKEYGIQAEGSIAMEDIDSMISDAGEAAEKAAVGMPSDAVVWEEVEARTSENTELSASFVLFMVMACLIASVGILLDSPILIIGAMVVGPEFGPLAGLCVALVQRRGDMAKRSLLPLLIGFPVGITAAYLFSLAIKEVGLTPEDFSTTSHPNTDFISHPDEFSVLVALFAGTAGMLSLTNAKSGALVGVLISVTTIPAAANIGLALAYGDIDEWIGAQAQLIVNLTCIAAAGVLTLFIQRKLYQRRRRAHLSDAAREAGRPSGRREPAQAAGGRPEPRVSAGFDAVVIGAGPAGEVCAGKLADEGMRVAVAERELVAGECSYWACMPSKTLLRPGETVAGGPPRAGRARGGDRRDRPRRRARLARRRRLELGRLRPGRVADGQGDRDPPRRRAARRAREVRG